MASKPPPSLPESPINITQVSHPSNRMPLFIAGFAVISVLLCLTLIGVLVFSREDNENTSSHSQPSANLPTILPPVPNVTPIPSGDVVFVSDRTGQWEIFRVDQVGGNITQLTFNSPDINYSPNWSPDGTRIVYEARRAGNWDIYVMNADGTDQRRLTTDPATDRVPSWSPDGRYIAFASDRRGDNDIYIMNPDGTSVRQVTSGVADDYYPDWSPDSQSITYQSNRTGIYQIYRQQIDQDDNAAIQLTTGTVNAGAPVWSPDGSQIAYYTNFDAQIGLDIYLISASGGDSLPLLASDNNEASPSWSPNGKTVYFHQGVFGGTNIGSVDLATGEAQYLTQRSDRNWAPDVRVDRSTIVAQVPVASLQGGGGPTTSLDFITCPATVQSRLQVNERVRSLEGTASFLHNTPILNSETVGQVVPGLVMRLLEGPHCADGHTWWRVQYGRISGWVIETSGTEYWLESVEADVLAFFPPLERSFPPENTRILENGIGLTDGSRQNPGEFQVEWYCNLQNFRVQADDLNWFCTFDFITPIFFLDVNDFDAICQATYYNPFAFAIQDGPKERPSYRWRCYEYSSTPK